MFSGRVVLLSAGIVQLLICCAECKPQGSTLVLHDAGGNCIDKSGEIDCEYWKAEGYCEEEQYVEYMTENCTKTCNQCAPGSGCPEGFFNPSGPSSQCFKHWATPYRTWEEAREFCKEQNLTLATPNDDVNLKELGIYLSDTSGNSHIAAWLAGRGSGSGFLWEAGVGEQPGSSSSRRELDGHPGWRLGQPSNAGNDYCVGMWPWYGYGSGSTPYVSSPCYQKQATLCQL